LKFDIFLLLFGKKGYFISFEREKSNFTSLFPWKKLFGHLRKKTTTAGVFDLI